MSLMSAPLSDLHLSCLICSGSLVTVYPSWISVVRLNFMISAVSLNSLIAALWSDIKLKAFPSLNLIDAIDLD